MPRHPLIPAALVTILAALASPAVAQDEVPARSGVTVPDGLGLARQAAERGDAAEALSRYLRVLATAPDNVPALVGAGQAALAVGDVNAAAGFLSRADALDPRNGQVKAGLATTMLQNGNARAALRLFRDATDLGVAPSSIAADRGLAYDLRGEPRRAQADYLLALRIKRDDEVVRRLALSQAIAGDRVTALATLDPLLRKQDVPAWRARAFIFALTGDAADALQAATLVMPRDQVDALAPYLPKLATLRASDKASAVHLGRFPEEGPRAAQQVAAAPKLRLDRAALAPPPPPAREEETAQTAAAPSEPAPGRLAEPSGSSTFDREMVRARTKAEARADARAKALAKAKADAAEREKAERAQEAEERAAAKKNPARHWVQVAGGANKADLGKAWNNLKKKWPGQLAGRSPWTMHYRFTNRLLIGPFPTSEAAQDWVTERKKEGFATFRVETEAGDEVERVN